MPSNPQLQAALAQQRQSRVNVNSQQVTPPSDPKLQARKDLSAIGLTYHNQGQFVEAIKHNDAMAVDLFLKAGAVDVNKPTSDGKTLLSLATQKDVATWLESKSSKASN